MTHEGVLHVVQGSVSFAQESHGYAPDGSVVNVQSESREEHLGLECIRVEEVRGHELVVTCGNDHWFAVAVVGRELLVGRDGGIVGWGHEEREWQTRGQVVRGQVGQETSRRGWCSINTQREHATHAQ